MPFPEVYNALEQGVIDGQDNPLFTSVLMKFTEVNRYVTKSHHILTACVLVINRDFWNRLDAATQQIFREAAYEAQIVNRAANRQGELQLPRTDESVPAHFRAHNIDYVELTPNERQAFRDAMEPVYTKYRDKIGAGIFDQVVNQVQKFE
ncbi:MAG: TRAP transporter substrate-binding protein DctP [Deltaproteobacteria bacterium]|nr:TRAP transporter substrate-binding protein DctP [Candidatus Anaeroferrophillacea bacterium]